MLEQKQFGCMKLELIRETKGDENTDKLRFPHERCKVRIVQRYFEKLGIDYHVVTATSQDYWEHD